MMGEMMVADQLYSPTKSLLGRCPNCQEYGMLKRDDRGDECFHCHWYVPVKRLPLLISPRYTANAALAERRALLQSVRDLNSVYVKPRNQDRPLPSGMTWPLPPGASVLPGEQQRSKRSRVVPGEQRPLPWLPPRTPPLPPPAALEKPPEAPPPPPPEVLPPRPKSPWRLDSSIWAPRVHRSDGQSLYDTDSVLRRCITVDLKRALDEGGLAKHVVPNTTSEGDARSAESKRIDMIRETLIVHGHRIYSTFDFYACLGSSSDGTTISFNGYKQFIADASLAIERSNHCDNSHLDLLFVQVNSASVVASAAAARAKSGTNRVRHLVHSFSRSEWMHMLVRLAIMRYIVPGAETDISNAVGCLMKQLVERLVPAANQDPNSFRRKYCYIESVCKVFDRLKRSLRMLFDVYADPPGVKTPEARVLRFPDWMKMLKDLCCFDEAFQQRDGTLIFVFSRLRVVDEESERGKRKLSTLSFEDFLEALVRVATMKALPTRAELALLGARDAGTFLIDLRSNPTGYAAFVKARERGWDDPLRQPIHRCLEHLLSLIIRTIELGMPGGSAGGGADVNVFTPAVLKNFYLKGAPNGGMGQRSGWGTVRNLKSLGMDDENGDGAEGVSLLSMLAAVGGGGGEEGAAESRPSGEPLGAGDLTREIVSGAKAWGRRGAAAAQVGATSSCTAAAAAAAGTAAATATATAAAAAAAAKIFGAGKGLAGALARISPPPISSSIRVPPPLPVQHPAGGRGSQPLVPPAFPSPTADAIGGPRAASKTTFNA